MAKYTVIRTDTADSLIHKIKEKLVTVYAVVDQRQDYLNIIRGL